MKLYATTTSERASKGQGGNKFIRVEFSLGDAKENFQVMSIVLEADTGNFTIRDKNHNVFEVISIENLLLVSKGNKQKTAMQKCNNHVGYCAEHNTRHD